MILAGIEPYLKSDLIVGKFSMLVGFNSPPLPDSVAVGVSFIVIITDSEVPHYSAKDGNIKSFFVSHNLTSGKCRNLFCTRS
jgi:hypothetical protein